MFYTAINIPYGSMASAVSEEPDDRQSLSTFRTMGGTLAGVVIGVGLPLIAYQKVDGVETLIGTRVTIAAGVFSVLAVICYLLCYNLVTERVHIETPQRKQESVLARVGDARFSEVLRLYYQCSFTWAETADHMGYSERQIMRLHRLALERVQKILQEDSECHLAS